MIKGRHQARRVALQALYELDMTNHAVAYALGCRLKATPLSQVGVRFAFHLVEGVWENLQQIDNLLSDLAPEWPVDQIAAVDRNALRIAIFEMLFDPETPAKVVINEAVELAKVFGSDSAPRFVNGVLGSLVHTRKERVRAVAKEASRQAE
jgi:transcription antitermination protein NusB